MYAVGSVIMSRLTAIFVCMYAVAGRAASSDFCDGADYENEPWGESAA